MDKKFPRRKGLEHFLVPGMIITLIVVVVAFPLVRNSLAYAVQKSATIQAEQLASSINILQSSPETTHAVFRTAKGKCRIEINQMYVSYEADGQAFREDILQTGVKIDKTTITCNENEEKTVCFVKTMDAVKIFEPADGRCRR